jgi:hypothetical protein
VKRARVIGIKLSTRNNKPIYGRRQHHHRRCHHHHGLNLSIYSVPLQQRFSTFFNSRHVEQGAEIVKAHHQFFKGEILSLKQVY